MLSPQSQARHIAVVFSAIVVCGLLLTACIASKPAIRQGQLRDVASSGEMKTATFAAGCFWQVERAFGDVDGVVDTAVGLGGAGGARAEDAEVIEITFDPGIVTYDELLDVFWRCHNPTTLDRQGPDVGPEYRSAIFFHDAEQEAAARASLKRKNKSLRYRGRIVTEISPATSFQRAAERHQRYFEKKRRAKRGS